MKIIDPEQKYLHSYFRCCYDMNADLQEAGDHKQKWYEKMKDKGLGIKLAVNDQEQVIGMIQYIPAKYSSILGQDLYFISCIFIPHDKKHGRNFRKQGIGKALLQAAEEDIKKRGAKGVAAWGISLPFWMKASWYKKQGYKKVDQAKIMVLLWKPFTADAKPPQWMPPKKKPEVQSGKVKVTGFLNGWCPAMNMVFERTKRACEEFNDKVVFEEIQTSDPKIFAEWGILDAVFINDREITNGPPLSYEKIRKKIQKAVKK